MEANLTAIPRFGDAPARPITSVLEETRRDEALDQALSLTFPASDPTAISFTSRFRDMFCGNRR